MIAVVDYGAGNVRSVLKALTSLGHEACLSADPQQLLSADMVLFPGQGHFGAAMERLAQSGLDSTLRQVVAQGTPFIGICLGLQLLFDGSDEAPSVAGLGLLPGRCVRFPTSVKVPQIGWNSIAVSAGASPIAHADDAFFYFVHSYHVVADDPSVVVAQADHGGPFTAAVWRDNLFAMQFHPEKSGRAGLALLRRCLSEPWWGGEGRPC